MTDRDAACFWIGLLVSGSIESLIQERFFGCAISLVGIGFWIWVYKEEAKQNRSEQTPKD